MADLPSVVLYGAPVVMWEAEPTAENCIKIDLRGDLGGQAYDTIAAALDAGKAVGIYDSDEVVPSFALGLLDGVYVSFDEAGQRSNFATLDAALKFGLTAREGT